MDNLLSYVWVERKISEIKNTALSRIDISNVDKFYRLSEKILKNIMKKRWNIQLRINFLSCHTRMMIVLLYSKVDAGLVDLENDLTALLYEALKKDKWKLHEF